MEKENSAEENAARPEEAVSPYDTGYPLHLFTQGITKHLQEAQILAQKIYREVEKQAPVLVQLKQAGQKECRYVVDISPRMTQDIDDGLIKLTTENGKTYAQIRENGRYGTKLPIKREVFRHGADAAQLMTMLKLQALQEQIQTLAEQINNLSYSVKEVLQGQQNDRIGLYYSGLSLFLEAKTLTDGEMKRALTAQALLALTEATYQLALKMNADIQYLESKAYTKAGGKVKAVIGERMQEIDRSFALIHQAALLRAGIYCDQGELAAMATVLKEYDQFIQHTIIRKIDVLIGYDVQDDGTEGGRWKPRANLRLDAANIANCLAAAPQTMYLRIAEEEESV